MTDYSETALVRGMGFLAEAQAAIAHNLANVNSTGFKRQIAVAVPVPGRFEQTLQAALPTVRYAQSTDWTGGALDTTGGPFHLALEGEGFFMVDAGAGRLHYTRNGSMLIDREGMLANAQGQRFLGRDGLPISMRIAAANRSDEVVVSPDGSIRAGSVLLGQVGLFAPPDPARLSPVGQGTYVDPRARPGDQASAPQLAAATTVRQGHLEHSNVDSLVELVQMIGIQRGFQAASRALGSLERIKSSFITAVNR
jgi:flagellar basal body rod protein FlgG